MVDVLNDDAGDVAAAVVAGAAVVAAADEEDDDDEDDFDDDEQAARPTRPAIPTTATRVRVIPGLRVSIPQGLAA